MSKPDLNRQEWASLEAVRQRRADPAKCSPNHRDNLLVLAAQTPPLVQVGGMYIFITEAGKAALAARGR